MNGEQTRDAMVVALRRDLLGPLADPSGCYPGATPKLIVRGQSFGRPSEARTLFVADDGEEVLAADTPTSRYIVGALYPVLLRAEEERQLDAQQAAAADEADPEDAPEVAPQPPGKANLGELEADDTDVPADRPGRPSSFGASFVITDPAATLRLQVTGGRYEPFPYTVGGQARTGWHRIPVEEDLDIPLPADPGAKKAAVEVNCGPLTVEVGVFARPVLNGQRIITCYLVNRTGPGQTLAERVLFAARLAATLPPGSLAPYPDRDPDRSPETASLRLLYAAAPVRAVGHGVDATTECTATGDVIATEALPVAKVRATTPNVADDAGPLQVDMEELARWEPAATGDVSRMIASYRHWIAGQAQRAEAMTDPPAATARAHLAVCAAFADDMEAGWRLVHDDPQARRCLRWASQAMAAQRRSYAAETRHVKLDDSGTVVSVDGIDPAEDHRPTRWRPFQLAFMLANIGPVINPQHPRRGAVDVIWMPTGGGKTEAYLGLAAVTMLLPPARLHRRRRDRGDHAVHAAAADGSATAARRVAAVRPGGTAPGKPQRAGRRAVHDRGMAGPGEHAEPPPGRPSHAGKAGSQGTWRGPAVPAYTVPGMCHRDGRAGWPRRSPRLRPSVDQIRGPDAGLVPEPGVRVPPCTQRQRRAAGV